MIRDLIGESGELIFAVYLVVNLGIAAVWLWHEIREDRRRRYLQRRTHGRSKR